MSALTAAQLAVLAQWNALTDPKVKRVNTASIPLAANTGGGDNWGELFSTLSASVEALDTAISAAGGYFADPVANIAALKNVAAAARVDKQMRVVETDGLGHRSIYVFDSASAVTGDDIATVVPAAGTGRWFLVAALPSWVVPIINNSGGAFVKGQPLSALGGYSAATGKLRVVACNNSVAPSGVAFSALADGAAGLMLLRGTLTTLSLDTSGAAVGDPVYCGDNGLLTLSQPVADLGLGAFIVGLVAAVSATGSVAFFPATVERAPGRARGVATVLSAGTSVVVAVGAHYNGKFAQVSFASDPGAATSVWGAVVAGGNLTITVDGAPGADTSVYWAIDFDQ